MTYRLTIAALLVFLSACALGPRVEFENSDVFPSEPRLVKRGDQYILRCERPAPDAARPLAVRCEVEGDHLLVYVPILVSAKRDLRINPEHAASRVMDFPLTLPSRLRHRDDLTGRVFWLDPNGTQHPLMITSSAEAGTLPASSRGRSE